MVGGTVIAVDVENDETDPVAAIEALGGADVAIVLAVIPQVFEQAFAALRRGGRLVCVGLPPETDGPMSLRRDRRGAHRPGQGPPALRPTGQPRACVSGWSRCGSRT
jgi:threonine dehydrogenase-like Zn-dependent dehydrogenase